MSVFIPPWIDETNESGGSNAAQGGPLGIPAWMHDTPAIDESINLASAAAIAVPYDSEVMRRVAFAVEYAVQQRN
jgi:hypothetical protein